MPAGLTPDHKKSTTILKIYIEKYCYTENIVYMLSFSLYIYVFIHIPGCLALFPNDPVSSTENICLD